MGLLGWIKSISITILLFSAIAFAEFFCLEIYNHQERPVEESAKAAALMTVEAPLEMFLIWPVMLVERFRS